MKNKFKIEKEYLLSYDKVEIVPIVAKQVDKNDLPEKVVLYCHDSGSKSEMSKELYVEFINYSIDRRTNPTLTVIGLRAFYTD